MGIHAVGEVWVAEADDLDAAAVALGEAAVDEEVSRWVTPDEAARRRRATDARVDTARWLDGARRGGALLLVAGDGGAVAGLALWQWVDGGQEPDAAAADEEGDNGGEGGEGGEGAASLAAVYGSEGLARLATVGELVAARHPADEPHWYLAQMAVVPHQRGRGLGGALLRHGLDRADGEGRAAYLEASSPRNRALYARHGFDPLGDPIPLPDGGPVLQPMWRPARNGGERPA
ncbi:GNAT family N-acetyltransferase [Streptomyces radicis]|uniref:GNAT family N-acetyltransferase n=1 Tax=Streptomyces radicis TaxID=1750517 RepID=A0A3A9WFP1_9ACTN|nr:GNAT family N-acetyltransferase [Streptomyces radicis]RKN04887.1 GNAT family N-acetyltransferase [Streptomyces radicis]RKN25397.1 GNAT family N-acetyltransferase [Streptomyces radicis]